MQPVRSESLDHAVKQPPPLHPTARQAAAYIQDMTTSLRHLALQHRMATLALLLEMAAVEAADPKPGPDTP